MERLKCCAANIVVQAVDAQFVADLNHLWSVIRQAWAANKRQISRAKFDIEILLRIACDSRVTNALATVGLKKGRLDIILVVVGTASSMQQVCDAIRWVGEVSESLLILTPEKEVALRKYHNIEDKAIESVLQSQQRLSDLLAEKAAIALLR